MIFAMGATPAAPSTACVRLERRAALASSRSHRSWFDGVRVSSTAVRERLAQSDFAGAQRLLGRPYRMLGRVVHGRELGRTLGFPTANLRLMRRKSPVQGVMAVRVWHCTAGR
jgi:FAD synthase